MTRGDGSLLKRKGSRRLYIRYYVTGDDGKRIQKEEATHSDDPEVARKILAQRVATERCPPTKKNPTIPSSPAPLADADLYLMDIAEAARRMSTTVFAIRELIRSNKLKFISVGHAHLISPSAIQEFVAASEKYYDKEKESSG
jgi:excisionase family DNA binding protein